MMLSNAHLPCKGMIITCRLPTLYDMGITPLSLLVALSGGSDQLIFVLVDDKQLSQARLTKRKNSLVAKPAKQWLKLTLFLQFISMDKKKRLKKY